MTRRRPAGTTCAVARAGAIDRDYAAQAAVALRSPRVQVVDLNGYFGDRRRCYPVIGGALVHKEDACARYLFDHARALPRT